MKLSHKQNNRTAELPYTVIISIRTSVWFHELGWPVSDTMLYNRGKRENKAECQDFVKHKRVEGCTCLLKEYNELKKNLLL